MKLTLTLGLLLAGASVPALRMAAPEDPGDGLVTQLGAGVPVELVTEARPARTDELEELRRHRRELEMMITRLERTSEIERLERSIVRRREQREHQRELNAVYRDLEQRYEHVELRLERQLEEAESRIDRTEEASERQIDAALEDLEMVLEQEEHRYEVEGRARVRALEKAGDEEAAWAAEEELELEWSNRKRTLANEMRERESDHRQELSAHLGALAAERAELEKIGREELQNIEREMSELEFAMDAEEEDAEALAELDELRSELESTEQQIRLEAELEEIERRIEELECVEEGDDRPDRIDTRDRDPDLERDDETGHVEETEEASIDYFLQDFRVARKAAPRDLRAVFEALERLQEEVEELRDEVDELWEALEDHDHEDGDDDHDDDDDHEDGDDDEVALGGGDR